MINELQNNEASPVKVLGISDDQSVCDCCGKTNLKRVVHLELQSGSQVAYGTSCAAKSMKISGTYTAKTAEKLVEKFNKRIEDRAKYALAKLSAKNESKKFGCAVGIYRRPERSGGGYGTVRAPEYNKCSYLYPLPYEWVEA